MMRGSLVPAAVVVLAAVVSVPPVSAQGGGGSQSGPLLATLSGVVYASDGRPAPDAVLSIEQITRAGETSWHSVPLRGDATFALPDLPPGDYTISVRLPGPDRDEVASRRLTLDGTDAEVTLTLSAGATARGRVVFEGGAAPADPEAIGFGILAVATGTERAPLGASTVAGDWTFEIRNLAGERRLQLMNPPPGWVVRSFQASAVNLLDAPLDFSQGDIVGIELRLTNRPARVSGLLTNLAGRAAPGATVLLFAYDRDGPARLRGRSQADRDGRFDLPGLAPAQYLIVATELPLADGAAPALLDALRDRGTAVALGEGHVRTMNLRVVTLP